MKFFWKWLPTFLFMAVIWYFSSKSNPGIGLPAPWDKLAHFSEYTALGFFMSRSSGNPSIAWVLSIAWGALDEYHQSFVPMREAGIPDWIADCVGSAFGAFFLWPAVNNWLHKRISKTF